MGLPQPGSMPQGGGMMPPNAGMGVQPPAGGAGVLPPGGMAAPQGPPMGVAGPPPGAPPKLSTAPTASAMPVTEGMPTPWPLPTKTQQIRATNQAVAGANQAVQDASAGAGTVASVGEPLPPHEVQHVKNVFDALLNNSAQDGNTRKRDDIAKRLEELYMKLGAGQIKTAASQKVVQLVQAVEQNDYASASRIQMELCTVDWDVNKGWLMGVKRLLPQR